MKGITQHLLHLLMLPGRLRWGQVDHNQCVFFPRWEDYPDGHINASDKWRTVAGIRWGRETRNCLRLRAVRTGNGDVLLGVSTYTAGQHYSKPLCTVPAGSISRIRIRQHRDGHICLSVYRGGELKGAYWHTVPARRLPLAVLL